MTMFYRCNGCGGELDMPALQGRHCGMTGDEVPPVDFHWCRLCTRAAFGAVYDRQHHRRRGRPPTPLPPVDEDATRVMPAPAPAGVTQVTAWMPARPHSEPTQVFSRNRP